MRAWVRGGWVVAWVGGAGSRYICSMPPGGSGGCNALPHGNRLGFRILRYQVKCSTRARRAPAAGRAGQGLCRRDLAGPGKGGEGPEEGSAKQSGLARRAGRAVMLVGAGRVASRPTLAATRALPPSREWPCMCGRHHSRPGLELREPPTPWALRCRTLGHILPRRQPFFHCRGTAAYIQRTGLNPNPTTASFPPIFLLSPTRRAGLYIDARRKGNTARLINSSCEPNCETQKWHDAATGEVRVGIFALRDILPGEELEYDYSFQTYGSLKPSAASFVCMCGAKNCR